MIVSCRGVSWFGSMVIKEYIYGGHIFGVSLLSVLILLGFIVNIPLKFDLLLIAYLLPLIVYAHDHYKDIETDKETNSKRTQFLEKRSKIYTYVLCFYVLILLGAVLYVKQNIVEMFIFTLIYLGGGLLYTFLLKDLTKYIPAYKSVHVALQWGLSAAFLCMAYNNYILTPTIIILASLVFIVWLVNTIFLDFKDIVSDTQKKLKTIPILLGFSKAVWLLHILTLLMIFPLILGFCTHNLICILLTILAFVYTNIYVFLLHRNKDNPNKHLFLPAIQTSIWAIVIIPLIYYLQL